MILNVTCPHCGALLDVAPAWLGNPMECGGCGSVFPCPEIAEEAPPEDAPKVAREKSSRRRRDRDSHDRWEGYEEYVQDEDPDSYTGKKRGPGLATTSLILGILSLVIGSLITVFTCGFGGFVQTMMSIVGVILGYLGLRSDARGNAIAGMVLNVLSALFGVLWMSFIGAFIATSPFGPAAPPPPTVPIKAAATWKATPPPMMPKMK